MPKNKKRLQMQKDKKQLQMQEAFMGQVLADGVGLGLMDQVGYDEHGKPIYTMKPDFEQRLEQLKKTLNIE